MNQNPLQAVCPKCAAPRPEGCAICPSCGVIFAKVRPSRPHLFDAELNRSSAPTLIAVESAAPAVTYARAAFLTFLTYYTFQLLTHPIASNYLGETFLHLVNLPFHEAGHILLSPFGRFLGVAGGTLMQLLVPAVVAISFLRRGDRFGASIALWWLGESLADVAPYADDARAGQLPLLGGVTGSEVEDYHDWEVMLGKLGMLTWDHAIGRFFFVAGGITMMAALGYGAICTYRAAKDARDRRTD